MLNIKQRNDAQAFVGRDSEFYREVVSGLSRPQKSLPCRYFYDDRGSALFEDITNLPEYYPTRSEAWILGEYARDMVRGVAPSAVLVEFGSGSSRKTELLLRSLPDLRVYVMIDVSASALDGARRRLEERFPSLDIRPVVGDFSFPMTLDADLRDAPKIGFFPGSTIGNLTPPEAQRLLRLFRTALAPHGRLIVGVDLKKDLGILLPAYNDAAGVTEAFNLNLLQRINRELGADFDLGSFGHKAIYNDRDGRIEMHLVSVSKQTVTMGDVVFTFRKGETIHTENSYKYSIGQFRALARSAGWKAGKVYADPRRLFSVHELQAD